MKLAALFPLVTLIASASLAQSYAEQTVTVETLLEEMTDRDSVAKYPAIDFRLKQASSYNRASKNPSDKKGWFNNKDYNSNDKDKNFIRIEEHNGKKEWVLMDHQGAGAIVRTWMPFRKPNQPESDAEIRIYLDGATEPTLQGNELGLLNGTGLFAFPFAHKSLRSAVSFFPIPYAKSCKVTTTQRPFFFQFTFREYDAGIPVKTFTMEDYEAAASLTEQVGKQLLTPEAGKSEETLAISATLGANQEESLRLPAGSASVRELSVKLGSYDEPSVTRSVVLKIEFDGKETVWCPVGDFFGTGIGLHPYQGWYRTVTEDGTMTCRWTMPYQKSGTVSLVNLGDKQVDVELSATTEKWKWDKRSLYFHSAWRGQYPVPTRPYSDWNYVTLSGRGVYVGDSLTIMNPVAKWWGEGDEKIWVDGEDSPSIFGTGTEDYYAYSWGGVSNDFFEHPFHAQTRCYVYDKLNRKKTKEKNTLGYTTLTRTRSLDTMPFGKSLKLDMEVWSWTDCEMGYGVGCYWYGDADTTSNRLPDPGQALSVPPLPNASQNTGTFNNAVEFESMEVIVKPQGVKHKLQSLESYKGSWSKQSHLLFKGTGKGDVIEFKIGAENPVAKKLTLHATKSYDFGVLRFSVNGERAGEDVDLYSAKPVDSGSIELGAFDPVDGEFVLRVEVVGKNEKSKGTLFGLDCIAMKAQE